MSEKNNTGSIISELDERLNDIFGKDEDEIAGIEDQSNSTLAEMKGLMLTIDWEISDETIFAIQNELNELRRLCVGNRHVPPLLKMISSLASYLKAKKANAHPDTINMLKVVFRALEKVVEDNNMSSQEKRSLVEKEVENFRLFKQKILSPTKASVLPMPGKQETHKSLEGIKMPVEEFAISHVPEKETTAAPEVKRTSPVAGGGLAFDDLASRGALSGEEAQSITTDERRPRAFGLTELKPVRVKAKESVAGSKHYPTPEVPLNSKTPGVSEQPADILKSVQLVDMSNLVNELRLSLLKELSTIKLDLTEVIKVSHKLMDDLVSLKEEIGTLKDSFSPTSVNAQPFQEIPEKNDPFPLNTSSRPLEISDLEGLEGELESDEKEYVVHSRLEEKGLDFSFDEKEPSGAGHSFAPKQEETPTPRPLNASAYFVFELDGKRYAVEEERVIKVCKGSQRLLKKARKRGYLSMLEVKPPFASLKKGIEPFWAQISSKSLKGTKFSIIDSDSLVDARNAEGDGLLFLGAGERRYVLFTDLLPKKEIVGNEDEIKPVYDRLLILGNFRKKAKGNDPYLIVDVDNLS